MKKHQLYANKDICEREKGTWKIRLKISGQLNGNKGTITILGGQYSSGVTDISNNEVEALKGWF